MARDEANDPGSAIMHTALLALLSSPRDKLARDRGFVVARRAAAFRDVLVDPDVVRVAGLVGREEARGA